MDGWMDGFFLSYNFTNVWHYDLTTKYGWLRDSRTDRRTERKKEGTKEYIKKLQLAIIMYDLNNAH